MNKVPTTVMDLDLVKKSDEGSYGVYGSGAHSPTLGKIKLILKDLPNYFIPVGSVIRGKENPGDLDLISTRPLKDAYKYFENNYDIVSVTSYGSKRSDFTIKFDDEHIPINLWFSHKDSLGVKKLLLDYPRGLVIGIRKKLKKMGYKLGDDALYKDGILVEITDSKDIFKYAQIEYRTPEEEESRRMK